MVLVDAHAMGLFWSNSWSLALIFCTHAKKNPTSNLPNLEARFNIVFFFFGKPENRKNHKKFKIARNVKLLTRILL